MRGKSILHTMTILKDCGGSRPLAGASSIRMMAFSSYSRLSAFSGGSGTMRSSGVGDINGKV